MEGEGAAEAPHLLRGRRGEQAAAVYLRRAGLKVLYRNFAGSNGGELDLVCREGDVLVFVEVKTRADESMGAPAEAVDEAQMRRILDGAREWLRLLGHPPLDLRFDILEVIWPRGTEFDRRPAEIRHLRDCFCFPPSAPYQPAAPKRKRLRHW